MDQENDLKLSAINYDQDMTGRRTEAIKPAPGGYRADIDGLRAIAVTLVIGYHIGFNHFNGGFIGVDIFFVISGYLISSILLRDIEAGRFSIAAFYERRIRRIFPALVGVLLFTTILAWRYCFPNAMADYAKSFISAILSVSNIYFWQKSGYFDFTSARRPLLHTWSLAVEEQFYIVFPLLLVFLHRYARRRLAQVVVLLAVVSLIASAVLVVHYPASTFYLAPTRAWELLVGTVLSLGLIKLPDRRPIREFTGAAGLLLLLAGALFINASMPFPGAIALVPCIGAALLILGGQRSDTFTAKLLSFRPIVFIGTISYSLYLWHWPLFAFRLYDFKERVALSGRSVRLLLLAEVLVLGYLSWRFIETPFRKGFRSSRRALFLWTGAISATAVALAVVTIADHGIPQRYAPDVLQVASFYGTDQFISRERQCMMMDDSNHFDTTACLPHTAGKPAYVLAGSSHAAHLWIGLSTAFPEIDWQQVTAANCRPTIDQPAGTPAFCRNLMDFLFKQYLPSHHVDAVVLSAIWSVDDLPAVDATLTYLASLHLKVFVVGPIMRYGMPAPELLAMGLREGNNRPAESHLLDTPFDVDTALASLVSHHDNAVYISLTGLLCPNRHCELYVRPLYPLQSDEGHLTREGSIFVAERLHAHHVFQ